MKILVGFLFASLAFGQNYASFAGVITTYPVARVSFLRSQGIKKDLLLDSSLVVYFPMSHAPGLLQNFDNSASGLTATKTGSFSSPVTYQGKTGPLTPYWQKSNSNSFTISPTPTITVPFSACAWVKPNNPTTTAFPRILETNYVSGLYLGGNGSGQYLFGVNNNVTTVAGTITTGTWPANPWVQICGVYSGTTATLYLNGSSAAGPTVITSPGTQTLAMAIGYCSSAGSGGCSGASGAWDGQIESVRVYNRALASGEIAAIYAAENH